MRIDRLALMRFGPFTDVTLDLARGTQGLHVVFGRNEAGKSSALRAISDLLFGIDPRSADKFVHDYSAMRLGGSIRNRDDRVLDFVRRKGTKNLLWTAGETEPLADDALAPFLRGLDRSEFERVFGLDHVRLREGARALLDSGDGATAAIVGSGLGLPDLRRALGDLQERADSRYRPRGSARPINKLLSAIRDAEKELTALAVTGTRWQELRGTAERAQAALESARAKQAGLEAQREVLERVRRVREPIGALRDARSRLPNGITIAALPEDFGRRRRELSEALANSSGAFTAATDRLRALRTRREEIAVDPRVLACADEITELADLAATTAKALSDRHRLEVDLARHRTERDRIAQALGVAVSESAIANLRMSLHRQATDPALAHAMRDARKLGDVGARIQQSKAQVVQTERALGEALERFRALTGCTSSLDGVFTLALPGAAWIDDVDSRVTGLETAQRDIDVEIRRQIDTTERRQLDLDRACADGDVPSGSALADARSLRDRLWSLARRAWTRGEDVAARAADLDPEHPLPEAVEHAIQRADRVADVLRAEADRVATVAALGRDIEECRRNLLGLRADSDRIRSEHEISLAAWTSTWRALGLLALPTKRGREVLEAHGEIVKLRELRRVAEDAHLKLGEAVEDARRSLVRALAADAATEYEVLFDRAEAEIARVQGGERLLREHDTAADLAERCEGIMRDVADFARRVSAVVARCADDLIDRDPHVVAAQLARRLATAKEAKSSRDTIDLEVGKTEETLRGIHARRVTLDEGLLGLCHEAGIADGALLHVVEEASRAIAQLRREGEPSALEALVVAHDGIDLDAALDALAPSLAEARSDVENLTGTWTDADREFRAIDGTPHAAAKAQEIQGLRAELRNDVEHYLRDLLAARMLAAGLERYREQNATPVLRAASAYFAGLTRGRYTTVLSDVDDKDVPHLLVRATEPPRELTVEQLSDGTRDQLSLALILGSLECGLEHREPVPLVLDDVLVHFDDERSQAALEVLATFAERTQVLLFTHHRRIEEQAAALGESRGVFIHHLAR